MATLLHCFTWLLTGIGESFVKHWLGHEVAISSQCSIHPSIQHLSLLSCTQDRVGCWRLSQLSCGRGWGYTCGQVDEQSSRLTPTGNLELPTWPHVFGMLEGSWRESAELKEHRETRRRIGIEPSAFLLWGYGVDYSRKSYCHCSLMYVCPISFPSKTLPIPFPIPSRDGCIKYS